ncbi:hypothetical protein FSARC_14703, partial [Fusarium sarcochroum]
MALRGSLHFHLFSAWGSHRTLIYTTPQTMSQVLGKRPNDKEKSIQAIKQAKLSHDEEYTTGTETCTIDPRQSKNLLDGVPDSIDPLASSQISYIVISDDEDDDLGDKEAPLSMVQPAVNHIVSGDLVVPLASAIPKSYEVCFGLLFLRSTCEHYIAPLLRCTPASLQIEDGLIKVYIESSRKQITVVKCDTLARVMRKFTVTLTATVCTKQQSMFSASDTKRRNAFHIESTSFCYLRVVVYGFLKEMKDIATSLAEDCLFFQHPGEMEYDRTVKYKNPHYLLPPGEDMPDIESLSVYTCCAKRGGRSGEVRNSLAELDQDQIIRVFNTAYQAKEALRTIEPSQRLATKLKSFIKTPNRGAYDDGGERTRTVREGPVPKHMEIRPDLMWKIGEMGLGKTLSMLSLICHFLDIRRNVTKDKHTCTNTTLIVAPKSTIYGWEKQIRTTDGCVSHIRADEISWATYHGPKRQEVWDSIDSLDIVLTTYETLKSDQSKKSPLFELVWARIVLDEAHRIRNRSSRVFSIMNSIQAESRWCLTGTPIQNYLDDFGALLAFVKVPPFESKWGFNKFISGPINKNKKSLSLLKEVVAATCLRRTKLDHAETLCLPQKNDRLEIIELDDSDRRLYDFFKRSSYLNGYLHPAPDKKGSTNILVLISLLRLICDHGQALLPKSALSAWDERNEGALTWEMLESSIERCTSCESQIEGLDITESIEGRFKCGHLFCGSCMAALQDFADPVWCPECKRMVASGEDSSIPAAGIPTPRDIANIHLTPEYPPSAKVEALLRNIMDKTKSLGREGKPAKCVVFSCWTKMLDLIAIALKNKDITWGRIDGHSSMSKRKRILEIFNSDLRCNVLLASIGAAGEGIDLTGATTVHIMEPQWNPMTEAQAIDRVHRIGQEEDVEIIRYIVSGSIEDREKLTLITESFADDSSRLSTMRNTQWK